jgi:hypothetical protein
MRLFRRKPADNEVEERCPQCGEPVPDGAAQCMMCGVDLRPFRGTPGTQEFSTPETSSPAR